MSSNFRNQPIATVSGNLGAKVPVVHDVLTFHEQKKLSYYLTRENCIMLRWSETDLIGLKLKIIKSRCYETYSTKETKKKHKEEAKADEETVEADGEEEAPVPLVTHKNILH